MVFHMVKGFFDNLLRGEEADIEGWCKNAMKYPRFVWDDCVFVGAKMDEAFLEKGFEPFGGLSVSNGVGEDFS